MNPNLLYHWFTFSSLVTISFHSIGDILWWADMVFKNETYTFKVKVSIKAQQIEDIPLMWFWIFSTLPKWKTQSLLNIIKLRLVPQLHTYQKVVEILTSEILVPSTSIDPAKMLVNDFLFSFPIINFHSKKLAKHELTQLAQSRNKCKKIDSFILIRFHLCSLHNVGVNRVVSHL